MRAQKIAVTGGPSGGKTTLIQVLQKEFSREVAIVPEAASILYSGGFPRKKTPLSRRHAQRAICHVQRELEEWSQVESKNKLIVCDRGSLDSIAYWPGRSDSFFADLKTTRNKELSRYDWVFHLDTADRAHFDRTNPIRTENHREAALLNRRVKKAWDGHPQRLVFENTHDFFDKIQRAKTAIQLILEGYNYDQIRKIMNISF